MFIKKFLGSTKNSEKTVKVRNSWLQESNTIPSLVTQSEKSALNELTISSSLHKDNDNTQLLPLQNLPIEILISDIGRHLNIKDKCHLAQCSKSLHSFFQPLIRKTKLQIFLQQVAFGQQAEAEQILKTEPNLLLLRGTVLDYSGRTLSNCTAFQIALGADDTDMGEMLELYFNLLPNGKEEIEIQFNQQFSDTNSKNVECAYDFTTLVNVISKEQFQGGQVSPETEMALEVFRTHFTLMPIKIKKGKHFDMQIFINALEAYATHFDQFENDQRRSLYCRQVLGYLQRLFPVCYAQAFCQGLITMTKGKIPLKRSTNLTEGAPYPPSFYSTHFHFSQRQGLGFSYFILFDQWERVTRCVWIIRHLWAIALVRILTNYVEQKHQTWQNLRNSWKINQNNRTSKSKH